jgi:hypothetical protein
METIARSQGLVAQSLLTKAATSTALLGLIEKAARELVEDDFFSLTYSGHGGQINDVNNDEPDGLDETWALYDRELVVYVDLFSARGFLANVVVEREWSVY